jgi:hypothetical protein
MAENDLDEFLKKDALPGGRLPTLEEVDRAIEQPDEANPETVAYIKARPELVRLLKRIRKLE